MYVNGNMRPVENIPVRGIKENGGGGEFTYDIL
jgi:hypothetical protein